MGDGPAGGAGRGARPASSAKDRALLLLGTRPRSREELRRRLRAAGYAEADIGGALDDLESAGLIDDAQFARQVAEDQAGRRLAGDRAIRASLRTKGVQAEAVEAALEGVGEEGDRALALARRGLERVRGLPTEAALRRLFGLLVRRGYPSGLAAEVSRRALAEATGADPPRAGGP